MVLRKRLKQFFAIAFALSYVFTLNVPVNARMLDYWYSDSDTYGIWLKEAKLTGVKLNSDASFPFVSSLLHGIGEWSSALNGKVSWTSQSSQADIHFYGGTAAEINALSIFDKIPSGRLGLTRYNSSRVLGTDTYIGQPKTRREHLRITGYLVSHPVPNFTYNNYLKTATHEVGHAMGWRGHPNQSRPTWVMEQGKLENIYLSYLEKLHLKQMY